MHALQSLWRLEGFFVFSWVIFSGLLAKPELQELVCLSSEGVSMFELPLVTNRSTGNSGSFNGYE
jgi:hypothetical protein